MGEANQSQSDTVQIGISIYRQPLSWVQQCVGSALSQEGCGGLVITIRTDGPNACDYDCLQWLQNSAHKDDRLQLLIGTERLGTFGSYQLIFSQADTPFLCQLDADDWLEPNSLAQCLETLRSYPDVPFVYTDYRLTGPNGECQGLGRRSRFPYSRQRMLVQFITFHLRLIRRSAYNQVGGYNADLSYTGDYDLSLRLSELGSPLHLPKALYNYRVHSANTSGLQRQQTIHEAFAVATASLKRCDEEHLYQLLLDDKISKVTLKRRHGPWLLVGMHRSGTSLLALMLKQLGLELGDQLLPADSNNPDGYGEDLKVVSIHRQLFRRRWHQWTSSRSSTQQRLVTGWPDWGWCDDSEEAWPLAIDQLWREQATSYLLQRRSEVSWGWKDPRSTVLLEPWLELEPGLRVIGIYRYPWETVNALQRVKPPVFLHHPHWGYSIWCHYNRALLQFCQRHPQRCILLNSSSLIQNPARLVQILHQRWGWPENSVSDEQRLRLQALIRPDRHRSWPLDDPLVPLHRHCSGDARLILDALDQCADLPSQLATSGHRTFSVPVQSASLPPADLAIVITSFNQGDLLLEAVASVIRHGCSQLRTELLVVDDGSQLPRTLEVLAGLELQGIQVLRQANSGLPAARNAGIAATDAEILLFLDDDNRLLPPYLTCGMRMLSRHHDLDVIYGNRLDFGLVDRTYRVGAIPAESLWQMNRIDNCALIRRRLLERCGGYDPGLGGLGFEDWDLWLTALGQPQGLKLGYLDQPCFEYRVRPDSMLQRLFSDPAKQALVMQRLRDRHGHRVGHGGFRRRPLG